MALFTDGTAIGIQDLTAQDSGLLDVAAVEGINLTAKLALAQEEVGVELQTLFERTRTNHTFGLTYSLIQLPNLVATAPVRLWLVYQTLALIYRDGYFNQLNDRYKAKWKEFASLARWAKDKLIETGVAIVTDPLSQAGTPTVKMVAAAESGGTFYFSVAFVNTVQEEGKPSVPVTVTTSDSNIPDISLTDVPANAAGWNCYGGLSPHTMYLQNGTPLDVGTDFAFYPSAVTTSGRLPGDGQAPNFFRAIPRLLQRG